MNQYFLLIACLQLWPLITPVNPASTWGPLIFIFAVSATKEAWDDYNRYLSDKKANEKEVWVVRQGIKKHVWSLSFLSPFCIMLLFLGQKLVKAAIELIFIWNGWKEFTSLSVDWYLQYYICWCIYFPLYETAASADLFHLIDITYWHFLAWLTKFITRITSFNMQG